MGGSSSVTVGYRYYAGMHMILCHGPIDLITSVITNQTVIWSGFSKDGRINIDVPNIFGGDSREGGISGNVDLEFGKSDQIQNDYLQENITNDVPAYRGVVGAVLRRVYMGNNPYLKPWSFRAQRIHTTGLDGAEQWYDEKAPIPVITEPAAMLFAMDFSTSMLDITANNKTRFENMRDAMFNILDAIDSVISVDPNAPRLDIQFTGFGGGGPYPLNLIGKYVQTERDVDSAAIQNLKTFFDNEPVFTTLFDKGVEDATAFFNGAPENARKFSFFLTDGGPFDATYTEREPLEIATTAKDLLFQTSDLQAYGFNIDLEDTYYTSFMDNTEWDGVPVLDGSNIGEFRNTVLQALSSHLDMNPAHIIRECLTDSVWGLGYTSEDIDNESFTQAADTLFNESLGISILWSRDNTLQEFLEEILSHIDAALYVSRKTGKFVLKLIRFDYDIGDLITINEDNAREIQNFIRPTISDLVNSVSINYWDYRTDKTASITLQDQALIQIQGGVNDTSIDYRGFSNFNTASRIALRDLKTVTTPLIACSVITNQVANDLDIGSVFILNWPSLNIDNVVMRVTEIAFGDGIDNSIRIKCVEDKFEYQVTTPIAIPPDEFIPPIGVPDVVDESFVEEATYFELVKEIGEELVNEQLETIPEQGYIMATGVQPNNAINGRIFADSGAGFVDLSPVDFCPYALVASEVYYSDTVINIKNERFLDLVNVGTIVQINSEMMRVDSINLTGGQITVGRGVLDSFPGIHATDSILFFWDIYRELVSETYGEGEVVDVKIQAQGGNGLASLADTPAETINFNSRAIRPFGPGNIQFNGFSFPVSFAPTGTNITWNYRDRLQQTGPLNDFLDGDIGPEANTTYSIEIRNENNNLVDSATGLTDKDYFYSLDDELTDTVLTIPAGDGIFSIVPPSDDSVLEAEYLSQNLSGSVITDSSTNTNDATATNIVAESGDTGFIFDGTTTSHIEFPAGVLNSTREYSVSFWLDLNSQSVETALLNVANSSNLQEIYLSLVEKLTLKEKGNLVFENQGPIIPFNAKTHIVITKEQK